MTNTIETAPPSSLRRLDDAGREVLFTHARTANSFAAEPVTDAELREIWELAKWPPTAANIQPLRVLYVRTDAGKARLVSHMAEGNKAKTLSAPAVAVLAIDTEFHEHIPTVLPFRPELKDAFAADDDMRNNTGRFSAALQAGYFLLAVRAEGLAAGPMGGFDAAGIDADFFPDGRWKSILVVNIGHPGEDPWFDRLPRLDHADVVRWA
ncbi:MAG TPA: malonic semialdehyde reductase [Acidothermaceae bacterium]|jgi:3-hydroxypropanoate dehydrogenase|nr:malonic semialdehyde reductase [Acidothermaceae bacterium]